MSAVTAANPKRRRSKRRRPERCVMLVDDETAYLDLLEQLLAEHLDCPVVSFDNPRKALKALTTLNVGLIVTDFNMPAMNGVEFIAEVQKISPDIPAIMITAYPAATKPGDLVRVPSLKAVVSKPFRWPTLAAEIAKHWPGGSNPPFDAR